jgi:TP901 family phage tail tape measure protein
VATLNEISVVLTANTTGLTRGLQTAAAEIGAFGRSAQRSGSVGRSALTGIAAGATVAAVGLAYAVTQAAEFDKAMHNVATIDAGVRNGFAQTSAQVIELSRHLPQSAKQLAEGLYDISSSGFQGANSIKVLTASATAASAGLTTTASSAKAITAVLNAYGMGADQATRVSDALFQTVNFGVVSFDELTGVIATVAGPAAAAGISIEQVGAAIATMTLSGLSGSEAAVSYGRVLQSLVKPNKELAAVQDKLGVSFTQQLADPAVGLQGVLKELLNYTGNNKTAFQSLFSEIRASRGVLALESAEGKNWTGVLSHMDTTQKNAGASSKALAEQSKGASFQFGLLRNQFNATAIALGTQVLPVLVKLTVLAGQAGHAVGQTLGRAAKELEPFFSALVDTGGHLIGTFHGLWEATGPLVEILAGAAFEGVAQTLNGVGIAASATTGFLDHNRAVVIALVTAYGLLKFPAIVSGFIAIGSAVGGVAAAGMTALTTSTRMAIGGLHALGGATTETVAAAQREAVAMSEASAATMAAAASAAEAAAAQSGLAVSVDGFVYSTGAADAALTAYAVELRAGAVAAEELAVANREAAASSVAVGRSSLAGGLLKGGLIAGAVIGTAYAIDQMTKRAKEALPPLQDLTDAITKQDTAQEIKLFLDSLQGSSSGDNKKESSLQYLQRYKVNIADLYKAITTGNKGELQQILGGLFGSAMKDGAKPETIAQLARVVGDLSKRWGNAKTAATVLGVAQDQLGKSTKKLTPAQQAMKTAQDQLNAAFKAGDVQAQNQAAAHVRLLAAQTASAGSLRTLSAAEKAFDTAGHAVSDTLDKQINLFTGVATQSDITAATLLKNAQDAVTAYLSEAQNIDKLRQEGLSSSLISGLKDQGPQAVAAAAQLSLAQVQHYNDLEVQSYKAKSVDELAITKATQPELYQSILDAQKVHQKDVDAANKAAFTDSVATALDRANKLLQSFGTSANPMVADRIQENKSRTLQAFLQSLPDPVRQAVLSALQIADQGGSDLGQKIVGAIIATKPGAEKAALDLYTKVQGQLDKLHGKNLQVVLDDLASGNIGKLITDLQSLGIEIGKLPAGTLPPGGGNTAAIAERNIKDGRARGGRIPGFDPLGKDDAGLFKLTRGEWVHNANVSNFYGDAKMRAVNEGRAQIIIPGRATGGPIGDVDSYRTSLTGAPFAAAFANLDVRVQAAISRAQQSAAAQASISGSTGGAARWAPLVLQALKMEGLPASLLQRILAQMNLESGGNPQAINLTDSNAQKGTPSKGLLQTIDSTFNAYHWPGTSGNVYDPLANIAAAINYGRSRYGAATLGMGFGHGYAGGKVGGEIPGFASGGAVNPQVAAYLKSLHDAANVKKYLTSLSKAKNGNVLKFLAGAIKLEPGAHSLAVRGLQDVYGMPSRNSTWDTALTDYISVHSPHIGAHSDAVKYLQLGLQRPVTSSFSAADERALSAKYGQVLPGGNFYGNLLGQDKHQQDFTAYLRKIVSRGFAPLASAIQEKGVDDGLAAARQMAGAPTAVLQKAQAAAVRLSASSKYGDALTLASQLAQYGGKVGLLGLASRSGTSVADVLGLVTQFPDVFKAMGSTARLLEGDLARLKVGKQPIAAYASGAYEIKQDHVAVVHQGETVLPKSYAEPWRRAQASGGGGGMTLTVQMQAGAITVGEGVSMAQVKTAVQSGVNKAFDQVTTKAKSGIGRRS